MVIAKIEWTAFAFENLELIFHYYVSKSNEKIAHKIRKQIIDSTKQLYQHPKSGQIELNLEHLNLKHRYLVSGNFKIIYREVENIILITDVFDTRQHPNKMMDEKRNKKK